VEVEDSCVLCRFQLNPGNAPGLQFRKRLKRYFKNQFHNCSLYEKHLLALFTVAALIAGSSAKVQADNSQKTLVVTMTNDPVANQIIVVDAATHTRLQTLSSNGKGGVGGN
jgi:hypothetical protein